MSSIWSIKTELPKFPSLDRDIDTEVLIIGGGLCGILTAYKLKLSGIDYVLLEAERICGMTTKCTTAKITSQHGAIYSKLLKKYGSEAARLYYEANEEAIDEYERLCDGIDCDFSRADAYLYSICDDRKLSYELSALRTLGIDAELTRESELPFPTVGAIRFKNQAVFDPLKFVSAIAPKLNIYENSRVDGHFLGTSYANGYKIRAKKTVVTTHFPFINRHGLFSAKLYQEKSYCIALKCEKTLRNAYLDIESGGLSLRGYSDGIIIGGGSHRCAGGESYTPSLISFAKKYYPKSEVVSTFSAQDCISLDGVPYIGHYSAFTQNLLVATGFNKWGMTGSMVAAEILLELIKSGESRYGKLFSPSRAYTASPLFSNLKETAAGLFNLKTKRCPHLGCALKWNKSEHIWECPCHGSVFDKMGDILYNPANKRLK